MPLIELEDMGDNVVILYHYEDMFRCFRRPSGPGSVVQVSSGHQGVGDIKHDGLLIVVDDLVNFLLLLRGEVRVFLRVFLSDFLGFMVFELAELV